MSTNPKISRTELLDSSVLRDSFTDQLADQTYYQPIPNPDLAGSFEKPVWRVLFEMVSDPSRKFGLDINGEVTFGRTDDSLGEFDLTPYDADLSGVSRKHILIRPTANNLLVMDLGSTNGTTRNGRSIGIKTPYSLIDGDIISLGKLQLYVHIIERPHIQTQPLISRDSTVTEALASIAKAITSQIDLDNVLNQVAQTAKTLTSAGEADIWLVDQTTGELFPEVQRSTAMLNGNFTSQFQMNHDPLVSKVIQSGKPARAQKNPTTNQHRLNTGHMMEALAYIPIMLGGIAFGVLRVGHKESGSQFDERDEQLLLAIADFAAIAIQNARLFQSTDEELQRRVRELSALNEVSRAVSASLEFKDVYQVLVDEINKYCPVEEVRLYLRDRNHDFVKLHDGVDDKMHQYPMNRGFVGAVIRESDAIVANDLSEIEELYDESLDNVNGRKAHSIAGIPLKIQERVVGVLTLLNKTDREFTEENIALLLAFANPVATAIENSSLFAESIRQRRAIQATAATLTQPLLLLDDMGNLLVSNDAANELLGTSMSQLFEAISTGVGRTSEVVIGEKTYLSTTQHLADVGTIIVMQDITYVKQLE
ncbi:MAG: GAF domain-containing protein, partial [Chloroflexota bacterium]